MLRTSLDQPRPADPAFTKRSDDELRRMREETRALLTTAINQASAQVAALTRPQDEGRALLEGIQQELAEARAAFAARGPEERREDSQFVADALMLFRVCARERCRKAQTCRGDPERCHAEARVPRPAFEWAVRQLLAERSPGVALAGEKRELEQTAYQCWIAGIEAGRRRTMPARI